MVDLEDVKKNFLDPERLERRRREKEAQKTKDQDLEGIQAWLATTLGVTREAIASAMERYTDRLSGDGPDLNNGLWRGNTVRGEEPPYTRAFINLGQRKSTVSGGGMRDLSYQVDADSGLVSMKVAKP